MTSPQRPETTRILRNLLLAIRHYLGSRRGWIVLAAVAAAAGLAFTWSWLIAAGVTPLLLLVVLPCAAMCALGLWIYKAAISSSDSSETSSTTTQEPANDLAPLALDASGTERPARNPPLKPESKR